MDWFFGSIYLAFCLAYLLFAWWVMRRSKRLLLLAILGVFMVLTNGIALPFLSMTDSSSMFVDSIEVSIRAYITMGLFMVVSGAYLFYLSRQPDVTKEPDQGIDMRLNLFMVFMLMVGVALSLRFLILGDGMQYVGVVLQSSENQKAHYQARLEVFETLIQETGRGVGGSGMAMSIFLPLAMTPAIYFIVHRKKFQYAIVALVAVLLIALQSLVFSQRSMLVKMVLIPFILWSMIQYGETIENKLLEVKNLWRLLIAGCVAMAVISTVYIVSDSMDVWEAFSFFAYRNFVIPAGVSSWYYELFPDYYPFRGLTELFTMGTVYNVNSVSVTYADVSQVITGSRYNANVSFLTVAYSAFGFIGVTLVSLVVCGITFMLDLAAWKMPSYLRAMIIANGFFQVLGLTASPFGPFTYLGLIMCTLAIKINPDAKKYLRVISQPKQNTQANTVRVSAGG